MSDYTIIYDAAQRLVSAADMLVEVAGDDSEVLEHFATEIEKVRESILNYVKVNK